MKKLISFFSVISISLLLTAQNFSITENQPVIIYSLPMTQLCIEVQMEKTTQTPGIFYLYSERYLATKNVITEEKTTYSIKNITVYTKVIPDLQRTYSFVPSKNSLLKNITLNQQGILCGINVECPPSPEGERPSVTLSSKEKKNSSYFLLPLGEEYLLAGSTAKLAEGAAKQIYDIRDSRLNILTCDVDHLPADGASLNTLLKELNAKEKELTELFVGKTISEKQTQVLYLTPNKPLKNEILFRFSTLKGVVPPDDLSGAPYYITISPNSFPATPAPKEKKKKSKTKETLKTILPASTLVNIGDGKNIYFSQQFLIPQFGVVVPLPNEILQNPKTKIYIDPQTGRLLKIE